MPKEISKIMNRLLLISLLILISLSPLMGEKKNVLIIRGKSTHANYCHNNDEVGFLIKSKLEKSKYAKQFEVTTCLNYPKDLKLVEKADLIIISSDGGPNHALADKANPTKNSKHLDSVLKKNKTGLIVIHWATDAPSNGFGQLHPENSKMMLDWVGAVYYWVNRGKDPNSSWTWKYPVLEMNVNKKHPISNGVAEKFKLQDEFYFNFFTEGKDSRTPKTDQVTFLHTTKAPNSAGDIRHKDKWREQACYWAYTRNNQGRSVAMTSAHMYHTWANPHFFKTFANSIFWTLNMPIPEGGVDISTPTVEELLAINKKTKIFTKAQHFK